MKKNLAYRGICAYLEIHLGHVFSWKSTAVAAEAIEMAF